MNVGHVEVHAGLGSDAIGVTNCGTGSLIDAGDGNNSVFLTTGANTNSVYTGVDTDFLQLSGFGDAHTGGGGDSITVLDGSWSLDAGEGNDSITIQSSSSAHVITTGAGADTITPTSLQAGLAEILDFSAGGGGDVLDLRSVLAQPAAEPIANYVALSTDASGTTVLSIDADGTAGSAQFVNAFVIHGVAGFSAQDLLDARNLVV